MFNLICADTGHLSLTIPPWVPMSTSQRTVMPCRWGVEAGMVREWVAGITVWSPCYHGPYLSTLAVGYPITLLTLLYNHLMVLCLVCFIGQLHHSPACSSTNSDPVHPLVLTQNVSCFPTDTDNVLHCVSKKCFHLLTLCNFVKS